VFDPLALTREVISLTGERWVTAARFTSLANDLQVTGIPARIAFFTGLKVMLRDLPPKVFSDPDTRDALMKAIQGALDEAIESEEEA
jgi:type III secretion protein W